MLAEDQLCRERAEAGASDTAEAVRDIGVPQQLAQLLHRTVGQQLKQEFSMI